MLSDAPPVPTSPLRASLTAAWPYIRRWAVPVLGVVILGLLLSRAHQIDWAGAWAALKRQPLQALLAAWLLATLSHALYGCFDLIGRGHVRHRVARWRSWAIAVSSYAFNLNLGSLVGGVALRARLYARAGLDEASVAQVVGISLATNWLGYGLLAGGLFASGVISLPPQAWLPGWTLRAVGVLMLLLAVGYVVACTKWHGQEWRVRGRRLQLPSPGRALAQLAFSTANWALMGAVMYLLLGERLPYGTTLAVLMAASIVGVFTPIPAGLGVLEAVYLTLLSGRLGQGTVMGAVLAYRALYYLLPLLGGVALYLLLERYAASHPEAAVPAAADRPR
ncbi:lysylphosphatidylglycerol synthase domain-containing protein [Azohydromonas australica]|uniref:lysylphosphatidylglycerol synthase domain-containing protein n=1 Tax=Azohydromonas australica TaxID=364039 RepID=UPI00048CE669|nr:lysylphosphatidylglycerol synthase domain-containing protein [Azohydromonas australica]